MLNEIIEYSKILNRKGTLPETYLRRNSIYYPFVSYINHTVALFIGENYDGVALFIKRADSELKSLRIKNECREEYFILCEQYLTKLSSSMCKNKLISDIGMQLLLDKFKE